MRCAASTTAAATDADAPGAGNRYDGPCTDTAATTVPDDVTIGADTELRPIDSSSNTQANPARRVSSSRWLNRTGSVIECSVYEASGAPRKRARTLAGACASSTSPADTTWASARSPVQSRTCTSWSPLTWSR